MAPLNTTLGLLGWLALAAAAASCAEARVINVKIGALLEESNHEQANMFIRTIKMINEGREGALARLLEPAGPAEQRAARARLASDAAGARPPPAAGEGDLPAPGRSDFVSLAEGGAGAWPRAERPPPEILAAGRQARHAAQPEPLVRLEPMIEFLQDRQSAFEADAKVCQLIESGVHAIVGPSEGASIQHVQSICDNMEIPYFELRPFLGPGALSGGGGARHAHARPADNASAPAGPASARGRLEELTLNLFPPAHLLTSAYVDLISAWNWSSFAIVYEDERSMVKLQDLFRASSGSWTSKWQIRLFQYAATPLAEPDAPPAGSAPARQPARRSNFRDIFWRIKRSGELNILLDVATENLAQALKQAQQVGCMTERYSYLITSLDLHTLELEDFKYSRTRITALSIIQVPRAPAPHEQALDEAYLERLGLRLVGAPESAAELRARALKLARAAARKLDANGPASTAVPPAGRRPSLAPPVVLAPSGPFLEPTSEAQRDWSYRRQETFSPGAPGSHLGALPVQERDQEQRLFELLIIEQQLEGNLSRLRPLSTAAAVLHDSLLLYLRGLHELDPAGSFLAAPEPPVACMLGARAWLHGSSLVNYMRRASFQGLTGQLSFDEAGLRADLRLSVLGMAPNVGLVKWAEWRRSSARADAPEPTRPVRPEEERATFYERQLREAARRAEAAEPAHVPFELALSRDGSLRANELLFERLYGEQTDQVDTLIVTTKLSQPYFMLKETPSKLEGNDQFEGFAVDLMHELSKLINFRYRWREAGDKKYGSKVTRNGSLVWNGMMGEIVRGQADLAIGDLTITAQREEAVDFTLPFMNTGISILFKKPTTKVTTLFSFLSPFSSDVWAYVLAAYCGISAVLFFVGHLSPYEWADPHPCRHSAEQGASLLENQFSLLNAFWFTIGSLMQQGSDLTPRSMSTRTIAGIWYFFTLIMISSYTANLAAFLTVEKVVYPIENVRDLSQQQEIKYGCIEFGSTCTFFQDSQIDTYRRINNNMNQHRTYVRSNDEGQKRVDEGKFAFFMESASIEYIVERNCNLTQIGGLLDNKGYGIATSKKSRLRRPYRTLLSEGILHLQETGVLHVLKNRWWKERRGGGTCTEDGKGGGVTELSLANVGGVFVVLLGGLGISFLVAIAEFMWSARRNGSTRDRMCEEMMSDLKFALACKRSTKPIGRPILPATPTSGPAALEGCADELCPSESPGEAREAALLESLLAKQSDPMLVRSLMAGLLASNQQRRPRLGHGPAHPSDEGARPGGGPAAESDDELDEEELASWPEQSEASPRAPMRPARQAAPNGRGRQLLFAQRTIDGDSAAP